MFENKARAKLVYNPFLERYIIDDGVSLHLSYKVRVLKNKHLRLNSEGLSYSRGTTIELIAPNDPYVNYKYGPALHMTQRTVISVNCKKADEDKGLDHMMHCDATVSGLLKWGTEHIIDRSATDEQGKG